MLFSAYVCQSQITDKELLKSIKTQRDSIAKRRDSIFNAKYGSKNTTAKAVKVRSASNNDSLTIKNDSLKFSELRKLNDSITANSNKKRLDSLKISSEKLDVLKDTVDSLSPRLTDSIKPKTQSQSTGDSLKDATNKNGSNKIEEKVNTPEINEQPEVILTEPTPTNEDDTLTRSPSTEPIQLENNSNRQLTIDGDSISRPLGQLPLTENDSIANDSTKTVGLLTDLVTYKAKDYMRLSQRENKMYLYDEAEVFYGDMQITAGLIVIDNEKNEVYAYGIKDSVGEYSQKPVFTQGQNVVEPDSIRFNTKTEKALVYNSRTEEGSFKVKGEVTKRENDSVYYIKNVRFTTSEDIDNPDYYFYARRIKFVPEKKIVTGLVNMVIVDVPTPLGLPFGYFPLTEDRTSGFIIPSYGEDNQRGFSLQNGGYYFAINDYIDLTTTGSYFTNGSYTLQFQSTYNVRYKYRGNFSYRSEKLLNSERGFPDFSEANNYNIQWSHNQDAKANPSSQFRASVNLGSSRFFQQSINQQNIGSNLVNNLSSSVSYSKVFTGDPEVNVTVAATHNQNTGTQEVNMTLPTLQAGVSRIYPFKPKDGSSKGAIENINFSYNLRGENRYTTTEDEFFTSEMFKNGVYGAQHTIPVTTNFKLLNYLSVSAGSNFQENWVFRTFDRSYDNENREVVVDTINGFDSYRTYNFNTSIGTSVYGTFNFGKDKKVQAIRHVIRPSISYNINPGFSQYFDEYVIEGLDEEDEDETVRYTRFQGSLFGAPTENFSSSIGLSLNNVLEAKVRNPDSTKTEAKKVTLLNNLNFRTSYNLSADSLRLAPISVTGSIPLMDNKLTINFNGALDPYALDNNNRRVDTWNIENGGSLFRLTNGNVSFNYSFSSDQFSGDGRDTDRQDNQTLRNGGRPDDLFGKPISDNGDIYDEDDEEASVKENTTEKFNYKIPWNLRLAYTLTYANSARQNEISSQSISISSDLELSPKWKVGGSTSFNVQDQTFVATSFRFQRDLGSFRMSFNWQPFRANAPWNFFIGIKSNILQDLKYEQRRRPDQNL